MTNQRSIFTHSFLRKVILKPAIFASILIFSLLVSCHKEKAPIEYPRLQSLYITMRDGVRIAADVWLPPGFESKKKLPAIMRCTRYWRASDIVGASLEQDQNYRTAAMMNEAGYALVLVDARGTGASFGTRPYEMTVDEVKDYGEIADWIVAQPWSNGKVGAYGVSYPGNTAEMLMVNRHPAVKVVAPLYNDFNYYDFLIEPGGVLLDFFLESWGRMTHAMDKNDICAVQGVSGEECEALLKRVRGVKPVDEDADRCLLKEAVRQHQSNIKLHESMTEFRDDPFGPDNMITLHTIANPSGYIEEIEASGTAVYVRVGWLDAATVDGALSRYLTADNLQKVIIGPWNHGGSHNADPFMPPDTPVIPLLEQQWKDMLDFFDLYLKDQEPPPMESSVTYYTLGAGSWNESYTWPPEGFSRTSWYFGPQGTLQRSKPSGATESDSYTVDYEATTGKSNRWYTQMGGCDVVYPDRAEEDKKLLTYTSNALNTAVEITGHPLVHLYIKSTAEDGAVFVYLEDVDKTGRVTYITEGHLRAKCRMISGDTPPFRYFGPYRTYRREDSAPLIPGQVADLTFNLIGTSVLIKKGHSLRVAVAGADKHSFDRYPRDGSTPTIQIERNAHYPSRITLPVKDVR